MLALPLAAALGAALLFLVQPVAARFVLPWFGGAPAVWTTSMLFFQALLLLGYAAAHAIETRFGGRGVRVHLALVGVALLTLPITPSAETLAGAPPTLRLLAVLGLSVGLPYLVLATVAPTVQARAAAADHHLPYRLYAWSNAGSIVGLLLHPLVFEPALGAIDQTRLWSAAFAGFAVLYALALWRARRGEAPAPPPAHRPPSAGDRLVWIGLSAAGSLLLLAVTEALSLDLSVTPVLWVLPLLLYLLTYVICFGDPRWADRRVFGPLGGLAMVGLVVLLHRGYAAHWLTQVGGYGAALFLGCMMVHGELVRARPHPAHLTGYYLWSSFGGALGGLFAAVVAPLIFPLHLELHVAVLLCWALYAVAWLRERRRHAPFASLSGARALAVTLGVVLAVGLGADAWRRIRGGAELYRSFFGVLQVKRYPLPSGRAVVNLLDGRISHGFQYADDDRRREPTAYFVRHSGVGKVLSRPGPPRHVGVVGLGVGTLAAYCRPGDTFRFYEINPDVERVARTRFTFLGDAPGEVEVVIGDGRLSLAAEAPRAYDVLVLDAFSGDAIPTHLLTHEAVSLYLGHLAPGGVLAVNVSNLHADLARVVRAHAASFGLTVRRVRAKAKSPLGAYFSDWMLLAREAATLEGIGEPPEADTPVVAWTDDHAPLLAILR
ncbi:MAG: fused MFS/spermidine synthase [Myxococcales bacterium]|nr:fused MFS/spermidine synthase [Myxococcales bacterium]